MPKSHTLDALCVGQVEGVTAWPDTPHLATSTGHGIYQRTATDKYGFPNRTFSSAKTHFGFTTGDLVTATVPVGKHRGVHTGRVSVRAGARS